ncbi:phosphoribosylglycinamide formyltransferase [Kaistia adipata]|uniref:phosphoribosylglycinamide formyltransferase n=1 Tax=Kaistia adipata TaxID=166954 RepID=UPI0004079E8A|nr:phosphoribosylglycinamide formyltransferase [Kaistia adipata]
MARKRVAILISGRGSNMTALIEAAADPDFPAEIALVLSNRADAGGLARAAEAGIATAVIPHKQFPDRAAFDAAMDERLRAEKIDLVCLAGFMRLLTAGFVEAWRDRMINIHPSLLPLFPGLDTHARAIDAGMRLAGCTVHFVRAEMDSGPIIGQAAVPVALDDTPETLAKRVLTAEHELYPLALALVASGIATVENERLKLRADMPADLGGMLTAPAFGQ